VQFGTVAASIETSDFYGDKNVSIFKNESLFLFQSSKLRHISSISGRCLGGVIGYDRQIDGETIENILV